MSNQQYIQFNLDWKYENANCSVYNLTVDILEGSAINGWWQIQNSVLILGTPDQNNASGNFVFINYVNYGYGLKTNFTFKVQINKTCKSNKYSKPQDIGSTMELQYNLNSGFQPIPYYFTQELSYCDNFKNIVQKQPPYSNNIGIQHQDFNSTHFLLSIEGEDLYGQTIPIVIEAYLRGAFKEKITLNFKILPCKLYTIKPNPIDILNYENQPKFFMIRMKDFLKIEISPFIQDNKCNFKLEYQQSNSVLTSNELTLQERTDQIFEYHFKTDNKKLALLGPIIFQIKAISKDYLDSVISTPLNVSIQVQQFNSQGPKFYKKLEVLNIFPGETKYYEFPDVFDFDNDQLKEVQLLLFRAQEFVFGSYPKLLITPEENHIRNYSIRVISEFQDGYVINQPTSNGKALNIKVLKPKLKSIDLKGLAKITFNTKIQQPDSYSKIDNRTLLLQIFGKNGEQKNIQFQWKVVSFQPQQFDIQIIFNDPTIGLQFLWSLINTVQLIVRAPLQNLNFPANVIFFYSLIIDLTNFNALSSYIDDQTFFQFSDQPTPMNFYQMDIFQKGIIQCKCQLDKL
ncbi:UNKNOWN [Stylonychia lemnae]|uniref:Uncharacterized protein n=1 Tax=Stylonychia lemnae TaxID=5949 RepID=A0A078APE7_STYLE|nr:UNKNOWN [Stylonychia lemnae]|eukprot:CDW84014.1 UNKNOWN [Stylonychia lemnae]